MIDFRVSQACFAAALVVATVAGIACSTSDAAPTVGLNCTQSADGQSCRCVADDPRPNGVTCDARQFGGAEGAAWCEVATSYPKGSNACRCGRVVCGEHEHDSGRFCGCFWAGATSSAPDVLDKCAPSARYSSDGIVKCCLDKYGCACGVTGECNAAAGEVEVDECTPDMVKPNPAARRQDDCAVPAPPPAQAPSSTSSSGSDPRPECTGSSDCMGRCSSGCYRCSSGSCACGSRGHSGACLY